MIISVFPSNFVDMTFSETHSNPVRQVPFYTSENKSSVSPNGKSISLSIILQGKTP